MARRTQPSRSHSGRKPAGGNSPQSVAGPTGRNLALDGLVAAGLLLMAALPYAGTLGFDFVNYDDPVYVPDNPHVRSGFSLEGIWWACTTFETANWYPLTWLSLMLDCQLFGPRAGGHHAVNVLLHAANSVLLFAAFRRMTGHRWPSAMVAALFAAHPLHVESVAWISERKDVLSTLFFLLTLLAYHRYALRPGLGRYALVFLAMALGLAAKSMLVTLPAVLLLLDYWPLGRVAGGGWRVASRRTEDESSQPALSDNPTSLPSPTGRGAGGEGVGSSCSTKEIVPRQTALTLTLSRRERGPVCELFGQPPSDQTARIPTTRYLPPASLARLLIEKLPLFGLSLAVSAVTIAAQASKGATGMLHDRADLPLRMANAAIACAKYLAMAVWPTNLAVYYPYDFQPPAWQIALSVAVLATVTTAALLLLRPMPWLAVGWFWFLGTLAPVIGLVQVGSQSMADRYMYIPSIGLFLAAVGGACCLASRVRPGHAVSNSIFCVPHLLSALLLATLLVATHGQVAHWASSERLFRHALAITGDNPVSCENLGDALLRAGRYAEAEEQLRKVLEMDAKHYRQTPGELAEALVKQGRPDEAIACLRKALEINDDNAQALNDLALILAPRGQVAEAVRLLERAIELAPQQPAAAANLAWIYATCPDRRFRNGPKAVELARRACELSAWKSPRHRVGLADAYLETGDLVRAAEELRAAIQLDPDDAGLQTRLEAILRQRR